MNSILFSRFRNNLSMGCDDINMHITISEQYHSFRLVRMMSIASDVSSIEFSVSRQFVIQPMDLDNMTNVVALKITPKIKSIVLTDQLPVGESADLAGKKFFSPPCTNFVFLMLSTGDEQIPFMNGITFC